MSETNWTDEDRAEVTDLGATEYGALVRDARRYRWLNERHPLSLQRFVTGRVESGKVYRKDLVDAAIDAAMETAK